MYRVPFIAGVVLTAASASGQLSDPVFAANRVDPCGFGIGGGGERFVLAATNDPAVDPSLRRVVIADWADVPGDAVFGAIAVRLAIFMNEAVPDATPGIIEGSSVTVRLYDADDGFDDPGRTLLVEQTVVDLPADTSGGSGTFVTVLFRLAAGHELGDTGAAPDGTVQSAAPFTDLDGDGLHDFGYEIEIEAPVDAVGDGIGVVLVGPDLAGGGAGGGPTDPAGMVDLYDERLPLALGGHALGTFSLGGAVCGSGPTAAEGTTPFAQVFLELGQAPCNVADVVPSFGVLDLADVDAFVASFNSGAPGLADLAPPFGILDLTDMDTFIIAFLAGCPTSGVVR